MAAATHHSRVTCASTLAASQTWSGGRADECTGLENRRPARVRGFESLPLRVVGIEAIPGSGWAADEPPSRTPTGSGSRTAEQLGQPLLIPVPERRHRLGGTGNALAGGSALLAIGAIDRPTHDIDAFVAAKPETPPGDVGPLLSALRRRLVAEGWTVTVDREHVTFARLVAERVGDTVEIDLAVDSPPLFPVEVVHDLPVLAGQDLAARKVLAIMDRVEGRDFTDLHALADRYSRADCIQWALELDEGVRAADIAHAFDRLGRLHDGEVREPPARRTGGWPRSAGSR